MFVDKVSLNTKTVALVFQCEVKAENMQIPT